MVLFWVAGTEHDSVQNDFQDHATGERPAITTIDYTFTFLCSFTAKFAC